MSPDNSLKRPKYVILTPARNESRVIEKTLRSVIHQTVTPAQWVIADDGSTDQTPAILDRYAADFSWISVLHRRDRGTRDEYVGAIGAILAGYELLSVPDWEFLVLLDADIELEPDYFDKCFLEFRRDEQLGIGGGELSEFSGGTWRVQHGPPDHVRGATKIYRRECWDAVGLRAIPAHDTYDEIKAQYLGWHTRCFPHIRVRHLRPVGTSWGAWRDAVKNGHTDYFLGYHPVFMLLKCLRRVIARPYFLNAVGHLWGYLRGYLYRRPQVDDLPVIMYLRKQQLRKLLFLASVNKQRSCRD